MIINGNCKEELCKLADNSVDAIVTDPPYEIGFMGKKWDGSGIAYDVDMWKECLRVLKPGGHLLAFSHSRTYHRMVVAIEDAGFEIRDQIMWLYGSGFPKGTNIGKAIPDAKQWDGWNTALKPAHEPICLARKPFKGTLVDNIRKHGVGAINIDGCRVGTEDLSAQWQRDWKQDGTFGNGKRASQGKETPPGRWPANLIHDGSDEVVGMFPAQAGGGNGAPRVAGNFGKSGIYGTAQGATTASYADSGSAARFFYCAKASKKDREEGNGHPTVKPTDLMRYLCRLITPPGGIVLDPFMGSGSTGKAAVLEGFQFIGIELSPEYIAIAKKRIENASRSTPAS